MSSSFAGKIALVTGGTKGIGRATAFALLERGAKVVANYGHDSAAAEAFVKAAGAENALAIQANASTLAGIEKVVNETVAKFGKIDILICAAGTLPMKGVQEATEAEFEKTFALNVKGPWFAIQKVVPHMKEGGRIVMFSSTQAFASTSTPAYGLYCASKGAIIQMVTHFARELASKGINVNAVAPGATATDMFYEGKSEAFVKQIASMNPHNRIGLPAEVANAILFLASSEASWVSGQIVKANGGQC